MYLDKYIEAAFKMWNVFKTDSVNCPRSGVPGNEALLLFCLALLALIGLSCTLKAKKTSLKYVQFPVFAGAIVCEEKQESSGRLKYILRKKLKEFSVRLIDSLLYRIRNAC